MVAAPRSSLDSVLQMQSLGYKVFYFHFQGVADGLVRAGLADGLQLAGVKVVLAVV